MTLTCLNLPFTSAYHFGPAIAGMSSVISGYPAPLAGGKKRSKRKTKKRSKVSKKMKYTKKRKSSTKKRKSSRRNR